ncbi:MAG: GPGG-motif small membrane protein [Actinomycetota bacterium]
MAPVLWLLAVILAIVGVIQILQGQLLLGIVLLVAAAAVGPGGWSVFNRRSV